MYCNNCGHEIKQGDKFCANCGAQVTTNDYLNDYSNNQRRTGSNGAEYDNGSVGLAILSFFFPIVGLILFLCWRKEKPKTAKWCGIAALISVILSLSFSILTFSLV